MQGATSFYDAHWSDARALTEREKERIAFTLATIPPDVKSVIDVGSGDGRISNALADQGFDVTAVDISAVALSRVRAKTALRSADDLGCLCADLVISTEMMEHLPPAVFEKTCREFARCASRYILITVPNRENLSQQFAKCDSCGRAFHIWGHERSFAGDCADLFSGFRLVRSDSFGDSESRWNRLLLLLWHAAGGWMKTEGPCYYCGTAIPERSASLTSRIILALQVRLWAKIARPVPLWRLLLYVKH